MFTADSSLVSTLLRDLSWLLDWRWLLAFAALALAIIALAQKVENSVLWLWQRMCHMTRGTQQLWKWGTTRLYWWRFAPRRSRVVPHFVLTKTGGKATLRISLHNRHRQPGDLCWGNYEITVRQIDHVNTGLPRTVVRLEMDSRSQACTHILGKSKVTLDYTFTAQDTAEFHYKESSTWHIVEWEFHIVGQAVPPFPRIEGKVRNEAA